MSKQFSKEFQKKARPSQLVNAIQSRDVNVLIFLDFSFRYDSVHQRYKPFETFAHYEILWHRVMLHNEFSALEYLIQREALVNVSETTVSSVTLLHILF